MNVHEHVLVPGTSNLNTREMFSDRYTMSDKSFDLPTMIVNRKANKRLRVSFL